MYELFFCCYERIPRPEATKEEYIWADSVDVSLIAGETWQRVAGVGHREITFTCKHQAERVDQKWG